MFGYKTVVITITMYIIILFFKVTFQSCLRAIVTIEVNMIIIKKYCMQSNICHRVLARFRSSIYVTITNANTLTIKSSYQPRLCICLI